MIRRPARQRVQLIGRLFRGHEEAPPGSVRVRVYACAAPSRGRSPHLRQSGGNQEAIRGQSEGNQRAESSPEARECRVERERARERRHAADDRIGREVEAS